MSTDSPFTFERVDDDGIVHYVLKDVSGKVACKAVKCRAILVMVTNGQSSLFSRPSTGWSDAAVEEAMRDMVAPRCARCTRQERAQ